MFTEQRPDLGKLSTEQGRKDALVARAVSVFQGHEEATSFIHHRENGLPSLFDLAAQSLAGFEQALALVEQQAYVHD